MRSGLRLVIEGRMPEKFLDRALAAGARIRYCERLDERHMLLVTPLRSGRIVEALAEKFSIRCERQACTGVDALALWMLRRRTLLAGIASLLAAAWLLLSRIWFVQVKPVEGAGDDVILAVQQAVTELGVTPGMAVGDLDRAVLRAKLISRVPEAGYVSVRRQGVYLTVEVSESVTPPATFDIGAARDVVAMYDAVVERVDVFAGVAAVQPGDTVRRGQRLIIGQERIDQEETRSVAADGVVMARIWLTAEAEAPVYVETESATGRVETSEELGALDWWWTMSAARGFENERVRTEFLPVGGVFVPVGILRTVHEECETQRVSRSEDEVKASILEEALQRIEENTPNGATVVDKWADYSMIDAENMRVKVTCELVTDIAATGRAEQQEELSWRQNELPDT
ncbi:MAG: sporulation protein YqfD [Clostridia bacterium]|nr:sporulation protein YqfD [Clostridia bacterium]